MLSPMFFEHGVSRQATEDADGENAEQQKTEADEQGLSAINDGNDQGGRMNCYINHKSASDLKLSSTMNF